MRLCAFATLCGGLACVTAAQAQNSAAPLDEVVVTGFLARDSESAMKAIVPIRDTPFSVSNYNERLVASLQSITLTDVFPYMTGVGKGGQSAYDLSLRGFKTTSNDRNAVMMDGLPGQVARFGSPLTFALDHIEVVKGPASVLYGKAQPGGFVNLISKKPQAERRADLLVRGTSFGDDNGYGFSADFTGPLNHTASVMYRVVADYGDRDSFRDFVYEKTRYVAPSVTWVMPTGASVTLASEYRWRKASQDFYLAAPARDASRLASQTKRYQEPDDSQTEEGYSVGLTVAHDLASHLTWKLATRSVWNDDYSDFYDPVAVLPDLRTLQRRARSQHNQRESHYADTSLSVPFSTGPVKHQLLVGMTAGSDSLDANRKQFFNGATSGALARPGPGSLNIDLYNPVYGVAPRHEALPPGQYQRRFTKSEAYGAYLTDFIELTERWKATVGIRYDHEDQLFIERLPVLLPERTKAVSGRYPMAGLLFQPNGAWTFYGSYSTSFVPQAPNFQDAAGVNPFKAEEGQQVEIGTKGELFDGRMKFTAARFDITRENTLALVSCNVGVAGTCMQEVGEEISRGWELEVELRPVRGWQTVLGYARADAKVSRTSQAVTAPLEGARLTNAPRDTLHVWSRYDFTGEALRGVAVGVGVVHVSEQVGNLPSQGNPAVLMLPSYTVVDAALYYELFGRYQVALKANNLFNARYYDSVGSTLADISVVPGAPRNVVLSVLIPLRP